MTSAKYHGHCYGGPLHGQMLRHEFDVYTDGHSGVQYVHREVILDSGYPRRLTFWSLDGNTPHEVLNQMFSNLLKQEYGVYKQYD